jgi:hypothetical protein
VSLIQNPHNNDHLNLRLKVSVYINGILLQRMEKLTMAHLLARNSLTDIAFWLYIIGDAQ